MALVAEVGTEPHIRLFPVLVRTRRIYMDPLPGQVTCPSCGNNYIPAWSDTKLSTAAYDRANSIRIGSVRATVCAVCAEPQIDFVYKYQHPRGTEAKLHEWTAYPHEEHAVDVVVEIMVQVELKLYRQREGEEMPAEEVEERRSVIRSGFDKFREILRETDPKTVLQLVKAANGIKDLLT